MMSPAFRYLQAQQSLLQRRATESRLIRRLAISKGKPACSIGSKSIFILSFDPRFEVLSVTNSELL